MRTLKEINLSISQIKTSGEKLDAKIQAVGLEVLEHISLNPEASLACKLYNALPNGARKNALVAWFLEFGAIKVSTGKNKKEVPLLWKKETATDLAGAAANPWFTFKPEKAPSEEFDFDKALQALIKKAKKASSEGHLKAANDDVVAAILKLAN